MRTAVSFLALAVFSSLLFAQDDPTSAARKELQPRPVVFSKPMLPLTDALAELAAQTGNRVADPRRQKGNPPIALPKQATTFWPALDAFARASTIGFSPYLEEGLGLVDMPYRAPTLAYAGIFRVALRRIGVNRDEETHAHHCALALEIAWEPRFRPFYVDLRQLQLTFAPDAGKKQLREKVLARGPVSVAGRAAVELELQAAAPDRSCPRLDVLEANVWAVGPSHMLTFRFDKLAIAKPATKNVLPLKATQDGVTVTIASIRRQTDVLLVTVHIENPKDGPAFDSYQSWLDNNRIVLTRGTGARRQALTSADSSEDRRGNGATVTYSFESATQRLPDSLDGWTLEYETPGRIVELSVPFAFKDVRLP